MKNFGYLAIVLFAVINVVEVAMVTVDNDKPIFNYAYKSNPLRASDEDLTYSDVETIMEKRENLLRKLRDFGVPSDVVNQMYPNRRMTIGDVFGGKGDGNSNQEHHSNGDDDTDVTASTFDPWTIVWYIGSFGGLIAFFLVVSCSEWCCLRNRQAQTPQEQTPCPAGVDRVRAQARTSGCETPPPSYHLFAPPSYDSINYEEKIEKFDIFVVPVHAVQSGFLNGTPVRNVGEQVPPPEYSTITMPT